MAPLDPSALAHSPRVLANLRIVVGGLMMALAMAELAFAKHPSVLGMTLLLFAGFLGVFSGVTLRRRFKDKED